MIPEQSLSKVEGRSRRAQSKGKVEGSVKNFRHFDRLGNPEDIGVFYEQEIYHCFDNNDGHGSCMSFC